MQPTASSGPEDGGPPPFVRLAAHPLRWQLLRGLVQSDSTVSELMTLVDEPQSLVSYHLRLLREGGLVSSHRSSADRRDSYYAIDLDTCREALQNAGGALHPALRLTVPAAEPPRPSKPHQRRRVLFLCTGNSARSQIAEALLAQMSDGAVHTASAGSHPKPLHPNAVRVLRRYGIDISDHRTKHIDDLGGRRFDTIITLCDRVREVCRTHPSAAERIHWSVPDPSLAGSTDRESYPAFERVATEIETRIGFRLPLLRHIESARQPETLRRSTHVQR